MLTVIQLSACGNNTYMLHPCLRGSEADALHFTGLYNLGGRAAEAT